MKRLFQVSFYPPNFSPIVCLFESHHEAMEAMLSWCQFADLTFKADEYELPLIQFADESTPKIIVESLLNLIAEIQSFQ